MTTFAPQECPYGNILSRNDRILIVIGRTYGTQLAYKTQYYQTLEPTALPGKLNKLSDIVKGV